MPISFDTFGTASNGGGATVSWSHTVGVGSNGIIFAQLSANIATGSVSSLKFAGTAMTKIIANENPTGVIESELWYLLNPPAGLGTFNGTWSSSLSAENDAVSLSYFGVIQTNPILGSVSKLGTATNSGINIGRVLTGTNSWFAGGVMFDNNTGTITTGNFRARATGGGNLIMGDNTAGTLVWSNSNAASNWGIVACEFAPFVPPFQLRTYLSLTGAGLG